MIEGIMVYRFGVHPLEGIECFLNKAMSLVR